MTCEFLSRIPEGLRMEDIRGCLTMCLAGLTIIMIRMSLIAWEGTIIHSIRIMGFHLHLRLVCWEGETIITVIIWISMLKILIRYRGIVLMVYLREPRGIV